MFCSKCGNKSPSGARFCQKCGAKVAAKVNSTAHLLNHPASLAELGRDTGAIIAPASASPENDPPSRAADIKPAAFKPRTHMVAPTPSADMDYTFYPGQTAEPDLDKLSDAAKTAQKEYLIEPVFAKPLKRALPRAITATNPPRLAQAPAPGLPEPTQPALGLPEPVQPAPAGDVAEFAGYQILPATYTPAAERPEYVYHDRVQAQHVELDTGLYDTQPVQVYAPQTAPVYTPEPKPTPVYTPASQPAQVYTPEPRPAPVYTPEPQPMPVYKPAPQPAPVYATETQPIQIYMPEPQPKQTYTAELQSAPVYTPDPQPAPVYTPDPQPAPVYTPDPQPAPVYIPDPKPVQIQMPQPQKPVQIQMPQPQKPVQVQMPTPQPAPALPPQPAPVQPQSQLEPQPDSRHMYQRLDDDDVDMPKKKRVLPRILGVAVVLIVVAAAAFFIYDRVVNISPNQLVGTWVQSPPLGQWIPRLEFRADGTGTSYHFNSEHNVRRNENYFVWRIESGNQMVNSLWPATADIAFVRGARPPRFSYRLEGYDEWRSFTLVIDP